MKYYIGRNNDKGEFMILTSADSKEAAAERFRSIKEKYGKDARILKLVYEDVTSKFFRSGEYWRMLRGSDHGEA